MFSLRENWYRLYRQAMRQREELAQRYIEQVVDELVARQHSSWPINCQIVIDGKVISNFTLPSAITLVRQSADWPLPVRRVVHVRPDDPNWHRFGTDSGGDAPDEPTIRGPG